MTMCAIRNKRTLSTTALSVQSPQINRCSPSFHNCPLSTPHFSRSSSALSICGSTSSGSSPAHKSMSSSFSSNPQSSKSSSSNSFARTSSPSPQQLPCVKKQSAFPVPFRSALWKPPAHQPRNLSRIFGLEPSTADARCKSDFLDRWQ